MSSAVKGRSPTRYKMFLLQILIHVNFKVVELERKMNLCKDVPALTARVSKVTGLMEMVAQMEDGDTVRY